MKKIVINADDFGMMPEVNAGIKEGVKRGVITSVSVMMNMPATGQAIKYLQKHRRLDAGLHLVISQGNPVLSPSKIPSLVNRDGTFYSWPILITLLLLGLINRGDVEAEYQAQLNLFKKTLKNIPSHIDSHHHLHIFPTIFPIVIKLATENGIKTIRCHHNRFWARQTFFPWSWRKLIVTILFSILRGRLPADMIVADDFLDLDWGGPYDAKKLAHILDRFNSKLTSVACHPAKLSNKKSRANPLLFQRQRELNVLLSAEVQNVLKKFEKTDYRKLAINHQL